MWDKTVQEVLKMTNSSKDGITQKLAEQRLLLNGKNEIPKGKKKSIIEIFFQQFKSPIILILIVAAIFSIIIKSYADAIFILIVILINAIIGTVQELKAQSSLDALKKMSSPESTVIRDGKRQKVKSSELVLGDIVVLEEKSEAKRS